MRFHDVPVVRCHAPAKSFSDAPAALQYARKAAADHRVGYAVWRCIRGRLRLVKRFPAMPARA
jgi:hypothetical protein